MRNPHPISRFCIHGLAVELANHVPLLEPALRMLRPFGVNEWPEGFAPVHGAIGAYDEAEVLRHVSAEAMPLSRPNDVFEIYQRQERFWLVDERWGISEINLLKSCWRSWVLPQPGLEPMRCAELAVLWPMAQLLRVRGLHVLPAVSVVREGWGVLILSPLDLEPELAALAGAGYQTIGRRWTALREEDGRIEMLHLPATPSVTSSLRRSVASDAHHAFCAAVLVVSPVRRASASLQMLEREEAVAALRRAWPIPELHPHRRAPMLPPRLAQLCRCGTVRLSHQRHDLLWLLDSLRYGREHWRLIPPELSDSRVAV